MTQRPPMKRVLRAAAPHPPIVVLLLAIFAASAFAQLPLPVITFISQTASTAGAPGFVLQGGASSSFGTGQVFFGGTGLVTTSATAGLWNAQVTAGVLANAGAFPVTFRYPDGSTSANTVTYTVLPAPTITAFNPISVTAGN